MFAARPKIWTKMCTENWAGGLINLPEGGATDFDIKEEDLMGEDRIVKSKFLMKVTTLKKVKGDEGNDTLKVTNEKWVRAKGKDFAASLYEERSKGIERKVEIVKAAPEKFQIGVIYVLLDGSKVWTYVEEE